MKTPEKKKNSEHLKARVKVQLDEQTKDKIKKISDTTKKGARTGTIHFLDFVEDGLYYPEDEKQIMEGHGRKQQLKSLLHLFLMPMVLVYNELLLRILNRTGLFQNLFYPFIFALALGLILNVPITVNRKLGNRIATVGIMIIIDLLYVTECLIHNAYHTYMTFHAIITGADGVMNGYSSDLIRTLVGNLIPIFLFFLPVILYLVFRKQLVAYRFKAYIPAISFLMGLILFFIGGVSASVGRTAKRYTTAYEFNTATVTFGLVTSLRLNKVRAGSSNARFVIEEAFDSELSTEPETGFETEPEEDVLVIEESSNGPKAISKPSVHTSDEVKTDKKQKKYGYNIMDLDLDTLAEESSDETILGITNYVKSLKATKKNEYTGLFKGKNLILICAEAFSDSVISEELTPTLYRLTHNGFYFSDYYQPSWGGSTSTGEYSFLIGLVPNNGVDTIQETVNDNMYFTLGNQLQRLGYYNAAFHNGDYDYYDRQLTHPNLGYGTWLGTYNGLEDIVGDTYPDDAEFLTKTLEYYVDQQPFSVYCMTVSGHAAYNADGHLVGENLEYVTEHVDRDYEAKTLYYLCYQMELEKALTELVEKLEEYGIADDTVICMTSDHYPYGLEQGSTWDNDQNYLQDLYGYSYDFGYLPWLNDHNSLIIWSGSLENEDKDMACEISDPVYSLDIVPTLSNLFGLEYDSRLLVGRDVFSDTEPLVLWNNGSWITNKGKYEAYSDQFIPNEGESVDETYVDRISNMVTNKISFSKIVRLEDYYGILFGEDTDTSSNEK